MRKINPKIYQKREAFCVTMLLIANKFDCSFYSALKSSFPSIRKNQTGFNYSSVKSLYDQAKKFTNENNISHYVENSRSLSLPKNYSPFHIQNQKVNISLIVGAANC